MGDSNRPQQPRCGECGRADDGTVRDLGLRIPYALCDSCFRDLVATRTLAEPLPLSRVLEDLADGRVRRQPAGGPEAVENRAG
ncbi:hypothetical protein [Streptomyces sp. KR80]|uniref:hypothetical protein n=1 Tax=Streptomyces sp. KR80 TaxID=3457426 RepID=UPI003FD192E4